MTDEGAGDLPRERHDRRGVHVRSRKAGNEVRCARTGGTDADADLPRRAGVAIGSVGACLLVTDKHVVHVILRKRVIERHDRATRVTPHDLHALVLQRLTHDARPGETLHLRSRLRHRRYRCRLVYGYRHRPILCATATSTRKPPCHSGGFWLVPQSLPARPASRTLSAPNEEPNKDDKENGKRSKAQLRRRGALPPLHGACQYNAAHHSFSRYKKTLDPKKGRELTRGTTLVATDIPRPLVRRNVR